MNVGQILETHLGWAARRSWQADRGGRRSSRAVRRYRQLRETLKTVYDTDQYKAELEVMDDQHLEQGKLLGRGVPMGTPVFDGAREADVISLLGKAGSAIPARNG